MALRPTIRPSRPKGIGAVTLEAYLMVLAFDLIIVENPKRLVAMKPKYRNRVIEQTRAGHTLSKVAISRIMKMLSERGRAAILASGKQAYFCSKGGHARAASMTARQRQALARKAARARWANHRRLAAAPSLRSSAKDGQHIAVAQFRQTCQ